MTRRTPEEIAETLIRGDLLGFILPDEGEVRIPYVKSVIAKTIREAEQSGYARVETEAPWMASEKCGAEHGEEKKLQIELQIELQLKIKELWKRIKPSAQAQQIRAALSTAFDSQKSKRQWLADHAPDYVWDLVDIAIQQGIDAAAKQTADGNECGIWCPKCGAHLREPKS